MTNRSWEQQWDVFHAAIELPSEDRAAYIASACGDDDALKNAVFKLVQMHATESDFLEEPLVVSSDLLDALEPEALIGDSIGPYVIRSVIGEGGMGVVYAADQLEPVRRRVALKVIKLGMNTREVVSRFELERQALALMNHPNVAKVYDAGATDDGRPYFVMEYVDGSSITSYCDGLRLSNRERLELCREVFAGIQHAHQKGLIHRDIKPSNVLIEHQDGERPVPKIIDFGIAKATEQHVTEETVFTALGRMIGTPAYMSPEQAVPNVGDVDTRSDIYSLSVLLYELLTGAVPFENRTLLSAGYAEMQRIIREDDPPPPSSRISRYDDGTVTALADKRHCNSRALRRELAGDLDWIIMKGLEKDPGRRYESVTSLAADIERHLNDQPVLARPTGGAYRLHKFVRRHTWGVAAGLIAVVAAIGFVSTTIIQSRETEIALRSAQIQKIKAEQVASFMVELLTQSDPAVAQGETITVREALDLGAEKIGGQLDDQPDIKMTILIQMAGIYRQLGLYDKAHEILDQALEVAAIRDGESAAIDGDLYQVLANLYHDQGDYEQAEENYLKGLEAQRSAHGDHDDVVVALTDLGVVNTDSGDYDSAEVYLLDALAMSRRIYDGDHTIYGNVLQNLAYNYMLNGNNAAAAPHFEESVAMDRRLHGENSIQFATSLSFYAIFKRSAGDYSAAVSALKEALAIYQTAMGEDHPYVASTLSNLAGATMRMGHLAEAESYAERAVALYERVFDSTHPNLASAYYTLASIRSQMGQYETAEESFRRTLELDRASLGDEHPNIATDIEQLAVAIKHQGRLEEAETLQRDVLARRELILATDHPMIASAHVNLASVLAMQNRPAESEKHCLQAIDILGRTEPDSPRMMGAQTQLAFVYWQQERFEESEELFVQVLEYQRETLNADNPDLARTLLGLGATRTDMGKPATDVLEEALSIRVAALGVDHPDTREAEEALARASQQRSP